MNDDPTRRLAAEAVQLGLRCEDLDASVHDAAGLDASRRANAGGDPERAAALAEHRAAAANNDGLPGQLEYLVAQLDEHTARLELHRLAAARVAPRLRR